MRQRQAPSKQSGADFSRRVAASGRWMMTMTMMATSKTLNLILILILKTATGDGSGMLIVAVSCRRWRKRAVDPGR